MQAEFWYQPAFATQDVHWCYLKIQPPTWASWYCCHGLGQEPCFLGGSEIIHLRSVPLQGLACYKIWLCPTDHCGRCHCAKITSWQRQEGKFCPCITKYVPYEIWKWVENRRIACGHFSLSEVQQLVINVVHVSSVLLVCVRGISTFPGVVGKIRSYIHIYMSNPDSYMHGLMYRVHLSRQIASLAVTTWQPSVLLQ